ncbi:MAG: preprotein translocase subunit SecE [Elusimicrobiales bacterium]|nr:preprotein translocase subunit SecE [Elusimicrobiales bacterium]MCK5358097.1 preprotein translocase subunit SecE [Elusimicrobiales bacterium]
MNKITEFLKGVYEELSKVTWLNRQDVIKSTIAVTVVVILVSIYISLVDFGLSKIIGSLIGGR